jgi:hypothetical protein
VVVRDAVRVVARSAVLVPRVRANAVCVSGRSADTWPLVRFASCPREVPCAWPREACGFGLET